jgi:cell division protease FtsH
MVCEWGMSDAIGPMTFTPADPLNGQPGQIMSEETAIAIDNEVKKLVRSAYEKARGILVENRPILVAMAEALLEKETISRKDIELLIQQNSK